MTTDNCAAPVDAAKCIKCGHDGKNRNAEGFCMQALPCPDKEDLTCPPDYHYCSCKCEFVPVDAEGAALDDEEVRQYEGRIADLLKTANHYAAEVTRLQAEVERLKSNAVSELMDAEAAAIRRSNHD